MSVFSGFLMQRLPTQLGGVLLLVGLSGCSGWGSGTAPNLASVEAWVSPYKVDVIQGNFVSREQAQALTPSMARAQVRDILGTPLIASAFHADRWDYVFTLRRVGQNLQQRRLTVFFKGDVMERVESDELPSEAEFVASIDARKRDAKNVVLSLSDDELKTLQAKSVSRAADVAPAPVPPITNYPPLEAPVSTGAR